MQRREITVDPTLIDALNEAATLSPEEALIAAEDEDEDFSGFDITH